ncbi:MAG: presenilin family intramembrane aspartyl protease [Candidatus Methanofastidiosia archaeon]
MKWYKFILANYIAVQLSSIVVAMRLMSLEIIFIEEGEKVSTSFGIFFLVLLMSALVLLLIKFKLSFLIYIFTEYLGLFFMSFLVSAIFVTELFALFLATTCVALRYFLKEFKIIGRVILASGVSAFLGSSLSVLPIIVLMLLLSAYDVLAVRKTRHMQVIAEDVLRRGGSQLFIHETDKETLVIGAADIVFPSLLVTSVFLDYGILNALLTSLFSLAGLFLAVRKEEAPALPYVSLGIFGFLLSRIIQTLF